MASLEWEDVSDTSSDVYVSRAHVPGGWLVMVRVATTTFSFSGTYLDDNVTGGNFGSH